jgi:predicted metalloprotease with PDZ domain
LDIHRNYPANKAALAGKQGIATPFRTPIEIPGLAGKYELGLNWTGKVVQSCVHCHQIGEAFRETFRKTKQPMPSDLVYSWPSPEILGLTLAADQIARVETVALESAAAKAGIKAGDDILTLAGQPLVSVADLSWALNRAPETGKLPVVVKRDGAQIGKEIDLAQGWRSKADISRRVGTWGMRGMATGGMVLEDLSEPLRSQRELGKDQLALNVKSVGLYGKHAAAKNAGFKKDDVIVALDGQSNRMSEGELLGYLLQKHFPGEKVKATVLRGQEKVELMLPMQ